MEEKTLVRSANQRRAARGLRGGCAGEGPAGIQDARIRRRAHHRPARQRSGADHCFLAADSAGDALMSRREALLVKSARSERTSALQQNPRAMADPVLHVAAGERLGLDAWLLVRDGQLLSVLCHIS